VTWRTQNCDGTPCQAVERVGRVRFRSRHGLEISIDDGRTWHRPRPLGPLPTSVAVLPRGGYLATGHSTFKETADGYVGELLRSGDGLHWRRVLAQRCLNGGEPQSDYLGPVLAAGTWVVAYNCAEDTGTYSEIYALSDDARRVRRVTRHTAHLGRTAYGTPLLLGSRLVVPVQGTSDSTITAFDVLTPEPA
jgi:hypothetical protein